MQANQRLIDNNGYEVMLFPMEYMNISQGEGGNYSHNLAMDFLGWDANGRVYDCPYYAPCSCKCVFSFGTSDNRTWESLNPVHIVKNDNITKVTFCFNHDNNPPAVGTILTQGDLIGHSGTAPNVGDHMHFNTAIGDYAGYILIPGSSLYYELKYSSHIYETCFINGTTIIDGLFYIWTTYQVSPPTPTESPKKEKFPWFIYANKIRESTNV